MNAIKTPDVVVVGGGPAGLGAAIAARLRGLAVTVVERHLPPIDKACGEGIMPEGLVLLGRLGVDLAAIESVPLWGIEFIEGDVRARARFTGGPGRGLRRRVLHAAMVRRAEELGVDLQWGKTVRGLHPQGVALDDRILAARWVVGADGMNSAVRRGLGLEVPPRSRRVGIRRHYGVAPWTDRVEVHWSSGSEAYVTPVGNGMVCVAILTVGSPEFDRALAGFPDLAARLDGAPALTELRGAGTVFRRSPRVVQGRVALVGDAAGSVDAITGDGITLALQQASFLALSLACDELLAYDAAYHRLMRLPNGMTTLMLAIDRRRRLRRMTLHTLSAIPWIFSRLLALHTRPATQREGLPCDDPVL